MMALNEKPYIHVEENCRLERQSDRAVLLLLDSGVEVWVPLSVAEILMTGQRRCDAHIEAWWAEQAGLV